MTDEEAIDLLEKQLLALGRAGIDISMGEEFFYVGEWELALEGVYVAHKRNPGILDAGEVQALVEDFGMDMSEFDG